MYSKRSLLFAALVLGVGTPTQALDSPPQTASLSVAPHSIQKLEKFSLYDVLAVDGGAVMRKQLCVLCRRPNSSCLDKMHIATRQGAGYTVQRVSGQCGDCPQTVIDDDGGYEIVSQQYVSNIDQSLKNEVVMSGTNYVPSVFNPLLPGALGCLSIFFAWTYFRTKKAWCIVALVLAIIIGAVLGSLGTNGPAPQITVIGDLPVSFERQIQTPSDKDSQECTVLLPPSPRVLALISSPEGFLGTLKLNMLNNQYFIHAEGISRPGKYEGKVTGGGFSATGTTVAVNVADWLPYLFVTFVIGILFTYFSSHGYFEATSDGLTVSVISVVALVTAITSVSSQYSEYWGSPMQYLKVFLAGAVVTIGSKTGLALATKAYSSLRG